MLQSSNLTLRWLYEKIHFNNIRVFNRCTIYSGYTCRLSIYWFVNYLDLLQIQKAYILQPKNKGQHPPLVKSVVHYYLEILSLTSARAFDKLRDSILKSLTIDPVDSNLCISVGCKEPQNCLKIRHLSV